jgi:hypothetical protein
MANLQVKGVENLSEAEKEEVNRIVEGSYDKIKRKTKVDFILEVVIKVHSKGILKENNGKKKHFSIKAKVSGMVRSFESGGDGWDLNKALHKALNALATEVEHTFHSSEQRS